MKNKSIKTDRYEWVLPQPDLLEARRFCRALRVQSTTAQVLLRRGLHSPAEAFRFLSGGIERDPFEFNQMSVAVERIVQALENHEKILVYGDYDVDGITGTVVLTDFLKRLGADVSYRVPNRLTEGYDLSPAVVDDAKTAGVDLIITNDCGVTANAAAGRASKLGLDLLITDHHLPEKEIPHALAIINCQLPGSGYRFHGLVGVGTVYKLISALAKTLPDAPDPQEYLDLVALGTVADVAPLSDENRQFVIRGLERMNTKPRLGLSALINTAYLGGKRIYARQLSYVLAPRLNAAGRVDTAEIAVELLLCEDPDKAHSLAKTIEGLNRHRRRIESETTREAMSMAEDDLALDDCPIIVVGKDEWHPGVVGIVASRLSNRFSRPAIVFGKNGRGSARGYGDFNVIGLLDQAAELINEYGGHRHAAGVRISFDKLAPLRQRLNHAARSFKTREQPTLDVDVVIPYDEIDDQLMVELGRMEPYGAGNPEPIFAGLGVTIADTPLVVGKNHLKLFLKQNGVVLEALAFNRADLATDLHKGQRLNIAYNLEMNTYGGRRTIQQRIIDIVPEETPLQPECACITLVDKRGEPGMEQLLRCIESEPTIVYCPQKEREELQRYLAQDGFLPTANPEQLVEGHYLFWGSLSGGKNYPGGAVNLCLMAPLVNSAEILAISGLAKHFDKLNLFLLYEKNKNGRKSQVELEREQLADLYKELPTDKPFDDSFIGQLIGNGLSASMVRLGLSIFCELKLLEHRNGSYNLTSVKTRRSLHDSPTYRRLRGFESRSHLLYRQFTEVDAEELARLLSRMTKLNVSVTR
jgi:single-stranded-DNA-specific exonuclease RecJ